MKDNAAENDFSRGGRTAWTILIVLTLLNLLNYMDRTVMAVALENIKADLGFTDTQLGWLQSIFYLSVGLLTLPAGITIDKWSRKKAVSLMAIVWSAATVATGLSSRFITLLASRFACGTGEAGFQPGGTSWVSIVFPKKERAKANGILLVGGVLGSIAGMVLGGYLITKTGSWRPVFLIFGIPGIILGFLTLFLPDFGAKDKSGFQNLFRDLLGLFKVKSFFLIALAQGFYMVVAMTTMSWTVALMMRAYSLNEAKAGMLQGLISIPVILMPLIGGIIADRMQARWRHGRPLFTGISSLIGIVTYAVMFISAGAVPLWLYCVILLISSAMFAAPVALFQVINMDVIPLAKRGTSAAMLALMSFLVFSWWGSTLVGKVSDSLGGGVFGLKIALLCLCPIGLFSSVCAFICCKTYPEDSEAIDKEDPDLA